MNAVPYDILLLLPAIVLSWIAGNNFGAFAARSKWLDNTISPLSYILTSTPYMWFGILLAWALGIVAGIFPISGGYSYALKPSFSWLLLGVCCRTGSCPSLLCLWCSLAVGRLA